MIKIKTTVSDCYDQAREALEKGDFKGAVGQARKLQDVGRQAISEGKATGREVGGIAKVGIERVKQTKADVQSATK